MSIKIIPTELREVVIIEPKVFQDPRGFFLETYHAGKYGENGLPGEFVQDNHSHSSRGILRGLHYQLKQPQGKMLYVVSGEIFDVAVDIRTGSPTFGRWVGVTLSAQNKRQLYIPEGFAHGFYVCSERADVIYKCTDFYAPGDEYGVAWWDPEINISWPLEGEPLVSAKDRQLLPLSQIPPERLPRYTAG